MFSLAYGLLCVHQLPIFLCALTALTAFLLTIGALHTFHLSLWPALLLDLIMLSVFLALIPKPRTAGVNVIYPTWDLLARMIAATSMVLLVTASARLLGPQLSGLLSPIPVLAWPLYIFVHAQQGNDGASAVLRGNLQGAYGVCCFYTVVGMLVRSWDPTLTYTIALLGSVLVSIPWLPRRQTVRAAYQIMSLEAKHLLASIEKVPHEYLYPFDSDYNRDVIDDYLYDLLRSIVANHSGSVRDFPASCSRQSLV